MISHLGRYEIIGELGQGAMGIVYKAKDPIIDRIVAIKTINLGLAMAPDERTEYEARFYQEAKAAGRLSHPNIVTVYDVGKSGDVAYIAMEFLQGRELRDILNDRVHLPVIQVIDIIMQLASGLSYAHEHGIVHRDMKPSNIMVIRDGLVKITDFGIARMASSKVRTQTGIVLGSPKYMSPEQVLGKPIDQRTDIFSLGVILYEMLVGKAPFVGDTLNAVMQQTINAIPPAPGTFNSEVPAILDLIVSKTLAKELNYRYQNAREFAEDLRKCRDELIRSSVLAQAAKAQPDEPIVPITDNTLTSISIEAAAEKSLSVMDMDVSSHLNTFDATMRLAETNAPEEMESFGKTQKITRPHQESINQASMQADKAKPDSTTPLIRPLPFRATKKNRTNAVNSRNNPKLLLLISLLLVLLGLAWIF